MIKKIWLIWALSLAVNLSAQTCLRCQQKNTAIVAQGGLAIDCSDACK